MHQLEINLRTVQEVLDFVALATSRPFPIRVGTQHHQVNAQSFMEMCCLNLREPIVASLQCSDQEFEQFCRDAERFLAK